MVRNKDNYLLDLLASSKDLDIALLKTTEPAGDCKPILLGDSDELKVGQSVFAIGYPVPDAFAMFKDFKSSMTRGSVSAIRSDTWGIQHTASISPGNSGGPLLNNNGELIGVNVGAITAGNNIFFSIPSNKLKSWLVSSTYRELVEINAKEAQRLGTQYNLTKDGFLEVGKSMLIKLAGGYSVFLDGKKRGVTPIFIEKIPPGEHLLLIQSEKEFKEQKIRVLASQNDTFIYEPVLEKFSGTLYVQTSPEGAEIIIRDTKHGMSPNVIDKVEIGDCEVRLIKDGFFTETLKVRIEKNRTTRISRELKKLFLLSFKSPLPPDAHITVTGDRKFFTFGATDKIELYNGEWDVIVVCDRFEQKSYHITIRNDDVVLEFTAVANFATLAFRNLKSESSVFIDDKDKTKSVKDNKLDIQPGRHILKITTKDMNDFEQAVDLVKDSVTEIDIVYSYSEEYTLSKLKARLEASATALESPGSPYLSHTAELEVLEKEIQGLPKKNPELEERARQLIRKSLKNDEAAIQRRIKETEDGRAAMDTLKWVGLGVFAVSAGLAVTSMLLSSAAYDKYQSATFTSDAINYRQQVELWDTITWIAGGSAGASAGFSLVFWLGGGPDVEKLNQELIDVRMKIKGRE